MTAERGSPPRLTCRTCCRPRLTWVSDGGVWYDSMAETWRWGRFPCAFDLGGIAHFTESQIRYRRYWLEDRSVCVLCQQAQMTLRLEDLSDG